MTNQERAEKIVRFVIDAKDSKQAMDFVYSQLDEAVREAWGKDDLDHFERVQKQGFREGFASARERAAGIVADEGYGSQEQWKNTIKRIRTMEPEDKR